MAISCTEITSSPSDFESNLPESNIPESDFSGEGLFAVKSSWKVATKSLIDTTHVNDSIYVNDVPWQEGEKVMLIRLDGKYELDNWGRVDLSQITHMCTVTETSGLKCSLVPENPLENGVYQAVYPVYDYVIFDSDRSDLMIHLSFLYEDSLGLDNKHQDIVVSDRVTFTEGQNLSIFMRHICALVDIDIYPPKTGNFVLLKVVADFPAFAGKVNYYVDEEYDINKIADTWFNFATLRGDSASMTEGELFHTSTGLLPVQYNDMPMSVYIVYDDGTYYQSEKFLMPSLNFGVENKLVVDKFNQIDEPVMGLWGDCYLDENRHEYDILHWEAAITK